MAIALVLTCTIVTVVFAKGGVTTANGWYEGEEIYYKLGRVENVTERGFNQLYLIGGDRTYQANVELFIPAVPRYILTGVIECCYRLCPPVEVA